MFSLESKQSVIDFNDGNLPTLQRTSTTKLDPMKIEDNILLSSFDFVNYIECKMPEKEARMQKDVFPLKIYESEKKTKFTFSELNPQKDLASKLFNEFNAFIFFMVIDEKIIFGDNLGNIKFFSLKENKITKTLQYPLKNTPQIFKPYSMDITDDEVFSFVGYENGQIAIFEKAKCKQIIKTGNTYNIINIKIIHHIKKFFQVIYSDAAGNVMNVNLKGKTFGNFEEQIESICKSSANAPYYLINHLRFKEKETAINKSLKELNDTIAFASNENVLLYTYIDGFNNIHTFKKPKYIKDNTLPDVLIGLGKQPSNNESTDGDADILILYLISWDKVIYLHVLPYMNSTIEMVIDSGYYVNDVPIIKIGFLNLSTIYLIDKEGNFKLLNSRKFNQGIISYDEELKFPIIPEHNNIAELQNVLKLGKIKSFSYLNNKKLESYIYSILDNRKKYEFYAFGEDTIYHQSLITYQSALEKLQEKGEWNDLFLLGQSIYKGKTSSLNEIPMRIEERKKKVKEFLQGLVNKYLTHSLNSNQMEQNMETIIEFCNEIDSDNYLFEKMTKDNNLKNYKNDFLDKLEPFILCDKFKDVDVPKNIILELIQLYQNNKKLDKLDQLLIHFNVKSLNNNEVKKKFEELDLISPQIYIAINDTTKDYFKPLTIIYDKYSRAKEIDSFKDYKDLIKKRKLALIEIKSTKQYIGHKLLWYLQKTLDAKKFPNFIESIDPVLYFSAVTTITYWLLTEKVFKDLMLLETSTFFNIINYIFSNEDILETFEENNEDPEKKAEALKILHLNGNNLYQSQNVDTSDLISYIIDMGKNILKSDKIIKEDKINLYLNVFLIAVGKRIKLDKEHKKEAIIFVLQNSNKYKIKLDIGKNILNLLEGKDFEIKDYDEIANMMTKGSFDEIRLFILKKKKSYKKCLELLLDKEVKIAKLDELIFTFINMTLTRLQIKKMDKEYKEFKEEVKKNLIKICQKSVENCYTIIYFWFSKDKKGCLNQLKGVPQIQLDYIEYIIKKLLKEKEKKDFELVEKEDYLKYMLETHIKLLCNLNKKNEIITWLKKLDEYPIKECIKICKDGKVYDALVFLYKKEGNIAEAFNICNEIITISFDEILKNLKSKEYKIDSYNSKKNEFIKFNNDAIETIEFEENSYNKDSKGKKNDNKHELWGTFLKKLYELQNNVSKITNIPPEKKELYQNISDLILNQIQNLIVRMSSFIGEKNVFDYVLNVNKKAKVIELKPFFNETLKSYGIEKNILNFYIEALYDFSLKEELTLETLNTEGEYFNINQYYCYICNNPFNSKNTSEKVIRFKCKHMQHYNCCRDKKICMKCLDDNYKKWACRKKNEKSKDVDDKEYIEFLKTYNEVKAFNRYKTERKKRQEKEKKNQGSHNEFYKNFQKIRGIDDYDSKNRKNFILDGVKFYMNKDK